MALTAVQIAAAIQTLSQAALSFAQIKALLEKPDVSPEDIQTQLDQTDSTIDRLKADDGQGQ